MNPVTVGLKTLFAVLAFLLFVLAGLGIPEATRFKYVGWGLASLTLAFFLNISA